MVTELGLFVKSWLARYMVRTGCREDLTYNDTRLNSSHLNSAQGAFVLPKYLSTRHIMGKRTFHKRTPSYEGDFWIINTRCKQCLRHSNCLQLIAYDDHVQLYHHEAEKVSIHISDFDGLSPSYIFWGPGNWTGVHHRNVFLLVALKCSVNFGYEVFFSCDKCYWSSALRTLCFIHSVLG